MEAPMDSSHHPLEAMVLHGTPSDQSVSTGKAADKPKAPAKIELEKPKEISPASVIDLSGIDRPALLLNAQLKIPWQNAAAQVQIWHSAGTAGNDTCARGIFDLLFHPVFKHQVANFSDCLEFFVFQLCAYLPKDQLLTSIGLMDGDHIAAVVPLVEKLDPSGSTNRSAIHYLHQTLKDGSSRSYEVTATNFNEGRLLVFDLLEPAAKRQHAIVVKPPSDRPASLLRTEKVPYILLAAQLDNAVRLRTEMMTDEYQRLISDLCLKCLTKVEHYGGVFGKHVESGFFAYFHLDQDRETGPMRLIECVFEIQEMMGDVEREWRIRKGWLHHIKLNMGLHWERGYLGKLTTSAGEMLTSFGVGLQVTSAISQLAQDGQVWATKALINQIPPQTQIQLRFGILRLDGHRRQTFIRKGFACVKDLFAESHASALHGDLLNLLPITQIFDRSGLTAPAE
jgi:class 3 adenylate cyclase